jgi:hypothetical protein
MNSTRSVAAAHRERYQVQVERDDDGRVLSVTVDTTSDTRARHARVNSHKATRIAGAVHDILRSGGVPGRVWSSPAPIDVDYLVGAQLELLLVAVRPLRRADRVDHIAEGIAAMSAEEASYWHAKLGRPGGLPALRLLLAAGGTR